MSDDLIISEGSREKMYQTLIPQIKGLIADEPDLIANCANTVAAIRQTFGFFWVGFYFVKDDELVLGPFQGEIACTRIALGKGVCGTAWKNKASILVDDVDEFPGHIACSAASKSEIVVPIIKKGVVRSVIDIDSDKRNDFTAVDLKYIEEIAQFFVELI